jgi:protein downstream neighbor of Son
VASGLNGPNGQVGGTVSKPSDICPSKITVPGEKAPLDFTLKTSLQFVSSSSVKWWVCTSFPCFSVLKVFAS